VLCEMLLSTYAQLVPLTTKASTQQITLPCMLARHAQRLRPNVSQPLQRKARAYQLGWQAWGSALAPCGAHGSVSSRTALKTAALALLLRLLFRHVLRWCVRAPPRPALLQLPSSRPALSACLSKSCVGVSLDAPAIPVTKQ